MPQSLIKLWVHIIFSTKNREKIIRNDIANELYAYMSSVLKSYNSPCLIINGTADHVHILCLQSKDYTLPKLIEEIKKSSSKWIKKKGEKYSKFRWQSGYGALSVSQSQIEKLKK